MSYYQKIPKIGKKPLIVAYILVLYFYLILLYLLCIIYAVLPTMYNLSTYSVLFYCYFVDILLSQNFYYRLIIDLPFHQILPFLQCAQKTEQFISVDSPAWTSTNNFVIACTVVEILIFLRVLTPLKAGFLWH